MALAAEPVCAGGVVAGAVAVLRGVGRGFGSGTPKAVCETSASDPAPSSAALQRRSRRDDGLRADVGAAHEGMNNFTGNLGGESSKLPRLRRSSLIMWTKHQMC
jgi:hypothetical protein